MAWIVPTAYNHHHHHRSRQNQREFFNNTDGDGHIMNSRCFENRRRKSYSFSQVATLEKRRKVALVNFRKHFWNCYFGQGKNWPIADRCVSTVTIPEPIAERISIPGPFSFPKWRLVGHVETWVKGDVIMFRKIKNKLYLRVLTSTTKVKLQHFTSNWCQRQ